MVFRACVATFYIPSRGFSRAPGQGLHLPMLKLESSIGPFMIPRVLFKLEEQLVQDVPVSSPSRHQNALRP